MDILEIIAQNPFLRLITLFNLRVLREINALFLVPTPAASDGQEVEQEPTI